MHRSLGYAWKWYLWHTSFSSLSHWSSCIWSDATNRLLPPAKPSHTHTRMNILHNMQQNVHLLVSCLSTADFFFLFFTSFCETALFRLKDSQDSSSVPMFMWIFYADVNWFILMLALILCVYVCCCFTQQICFERRSIMLTLLFECFGSKPHIEPQRWLNAPAW